MTGDSQHLDLEALNELKLIMGEEFPLLIETFKNDSLMRIQSIKDAVASGDPEEIRRAAHSFKGSASNMGAILLTKLCRVMEDRGYSGCADGYELILEQIVDEFDKVQDAMAVV